MSLTKEQAPNVLVLAHIYPNLVLPDMGLWTARTVDATRQHCSHRIISPVPYFPPLPVYKEYYKYRKIPSTLDEDGVKVYYPRHIVGPGHSLYKLKAKFYYLAIRRLVKKVHSDFKFNIIHAHFSYPDGIVAYWLSKYYGVPYVITEHAMWHGWMDGYPGVCKLASTAVVNSGATIAASKALQHSITTYTKDEHMIVNIPNGVNEHLFTYSRNRVKKRNQIVFVGFLKRNKGIDILLQAMKSIVEKNRDIELLVIGGPHFSAEMKETAMFKSMATDFGLQKNVTFLGAQPPENVSRHMSESAVLVLPSRKETFGSVLVEALACGTPIVATRSGGPEEIITEEVGLLVKPEDPEDLATALLKIIETQDRYVPEKLREHAKRNYAWDIIGQQHYELYKQVLANYKRV